MDNEFKNISRSYRPHYLLGFLESVLNNIEKSVTNPYEIKMNLQRARLMIKQYEEIQESEKEYTGIF